MSELKKVDAAAWRSQLQVQRRGLEESVDRVVTLTDAQLRKNRDAEARREAHRQRLAELAERSSAVCHDIVLMRNQDEWALAFGFLVNHSLGHLGLATMSAEERTVQAMLLNLSNLAAEMARAFPDRRMVVDPWQRAVAAMGDSVEPRYDARPHPHVESLSRLVLTLRDTGPSLKEFRAYYAPFGTSLHIIRPA